MSLAYWNGRSVPAAEVVLAPDDGGFLFGDGLFETLRVESGRAADVAAHLERLFAGLAQIKLRIPESPAELAGAVAAVAAAAPGPTARLRITVSGGSGGHPTRLIIASPYAPPGEEQRRQGVKALLFPQFRIDSGGPLVGLKSLCYQACRLALHRAEAMGAFEALLLNDRGRLVEGSRCNIALVFPDGVLTPPLSEGCLPGTVRRRLLERRALKEFALHPEDLAMASEVLLMNSLIGVLPVANVNGREIAVGPSAARLRALYEETVGATTPSIPSSAS
jgi:branched-chain amino acid aminotransferase